MFSAATLFCCLVCDVLRQNSFATNFETLVTVFVFGVFFCSNKICITNDVFFHYPHNLFMSTLFVFIINNRAISARKHFHSYIFTTRLFVFLDNRSELLVCSLSPSPPKCEMEYLIAFFLEDMTSGEKLLICGTFAFLKRFFSGGGGNIYSNILCMHPKKFLIWVASNYISKGRFPPYVIPLEQGRKCLWWSGCLWVFGMIFFRSYGLAFEDNFRWLTFYIGWLTFF